MFRIRLVMVSVLLIGSTHLTSAQTLDSRSRQVNPNPPSDNSKTNNTEYSKAELKRRAEEAKKHYELGQKYGHAGLFRQAAQLFLMSIELKPDFANAYFGLGHAYYDLGQWADAVEAFKKVIELNPKDKEAFVRLDESEEKLRAQQATLSDRENGQPVGEVASLNLPTNRLPGNTVADPPDAGGESLLELYKVGKGDVLEISLPDAPDNQATLFTVTENGLVEHPSLTQPLKVVGLTAEEITRNLKESIGRVANSGKNVLVAVREYNSHAIMVSGLVKEPGTKMLRREAIPLYVVLADAQPLPEAGQVVVVSRAGAPVQLDLRESQSRNVIVRPGDVITVQAMPTQYFYVGGEVKDPGEKVFRPGLTLTQAILSAGGVTEKGKKIELGRERSGGLLATINYKLKDITSGKVPDVPIQPGDRITVVH